MDIPELLQFERHIESLAAAFVSGLCEFIYTSRTTNTNQTPRIELKAVVDGIVDERQKLLIAQKPGWIYSAYNGRLSAKVTTNRTTDDREQAHNELIGLVRSRLQQFYIIGYQEAQTNTLPILIYDIRQAQTEDTELDTEDLDVTQIVNSIQFSINKSALPYNQ